MRVSHWSFTYHFFCLSHTYLALSGDEYLDIVVLLSNLAIYGQSIGIASTSTGFQGVDGILGIGPTDLIVGTLSSQSTKIPTVVDNLASSGTAPRSSIGIFFAPASADSSTGKLTFGSTDLSKY